MAPQKTRFGFQLFEIHLHKGTKRTQENIAVSTLGNGGGILVETLRSDLPSLIGKTRTGSLSYRDTGKDDDDDDTKPAIRILSATVASDYRIDFEFRFGRVGAHDLAIAEKMADDAELNGKASTNVFRASLYLPKNGVKAILAIENRGNLCPCEYFLRHLSFHMKEIDDDSADADKQGWWRLMAQGIADVERLEEILRQGKGAALQLEKHGTGGQGIRRPRDITVRQDGVPVTALPKLRALVYKWLNLTDTSPGAVAAPSGNSVEQIASLIDVKVQTDQFDDGAVVYDDGNGRTHTIRPHSVREVFIYPISEGRRPTPSEFRSEAESRIARLLSALNIEIDL